MGKVFSIALGVYVAALIGLPIGCYAIYAAILAFLLAGILTTVSATHAAEQVFTWMVGLLVLGVAWPAICAFAGRTALRLFVVLVLFALLYVIGTNVLARIAEHQPKKHVPPVPRPRLRADPPARHEPVPMPVPEEKPFDLFARRQP